MQDVKQPVRDALEWLNEKQSYESSYAEINRFQTMVNRFAALDRTCDLLAEALAETQGRKKEEVLQEFYQKAGMQ